MYLGLAILMLTQVATIGVFAYTWGSLGLALGASVWAAFTFWMKMVAIGASMFLVPLGIAWVLDKR